MFLDVTFELGTNLDMAQVLVQNRVSVALAKLPEDVKRIGVTFFGLVFTPVFYWVIMKIAGKKKPAAVDKPEQPHAV